MKRTWRAGIVRLARVLVPILVVPGLVSGVNVDPQDHVTSGCHR